jgi:hypothetical protein
MSARQVSVQLPPTLREKLDAHIQAHRTSVPDVMRRALTVYLDGHPDTFAQTLVTTLRSPTHWPAIHAALVEQTLAMQPSPPTPPVPPPPPRPSWSYQKPADLPPRQPPPQAVDEPPPF